MKSSDCARLVDAVLIETLWNVKSLIGSNSPAACVVVLIETLWNVKICIYLQYLASNHVLIETLWNVKSSSNLIVSFSYSRINRNIVECKVERKIEFLNRNAVLIETLWNVKSITQLVRCSL